MNIEKVYSAQEALTITQQKKLTGRSPLSNNDTQPSFNILYRRPNVKYINPEHKAQENMQLNAMFAALTEKLYRTVEMQHTWRDIQEMTVKIQEVLRNCKTFDRQILHTLRQWLIVSFTN